jgi:hypothetical protein
MTPELATAPNLTRTADPPPLPLVAWAVVELDAVPTAVGHCYRCDGTRCVGSTCEDWQAPETFARWLRFASATALDRAGLLTELGLTYEQRLRLRAARRPLVEALAAAILD